MREVIAGRRVAIVSSGIMTDAACGAAKKLILKGIFAGVIDISRVHPFDSYCFLQLASKYKILLTLEEDVADNNELYTRERLPLISLRCNTPSSVVI